MGYGIEGECPYLARRFQAYVAEIKSGGDEAFSQVTHILDLI